jgi:hypothetical protein
MCQDKTDYEIFHASFEIIPLSCNVYSSDLDPYDSIWLKLLTILVYHVEVIASLVMLAFVAYEAKGLAGHFRTLINHLLSYLYGGVSFAM